MDVEAVLVSFKVEGNEKTNETSGILFNKNFVLISGTSLLPLMEEEKWLSSFVKSSSLKLRANKFLDRMIFRVFVEPRRNKEKEATKEFYSSESDPIGTWKCPLVSRSLKKLFHDWTLGHGNFEYESEVLSSDDIDLSKELMSVFLLLKCKGGGELERSKGKSKSNDDIRVLLNLLSNLQKPTRGQEVEVVSTPFGNSHFMNSLSRGLVSNVVGCENCIILSDARTVSGCEGGPIFATQGSREKRKLLGVVTCPLTWCRGEWVGFTLGVSLFPVLRKLLITEGENTVTIENKSRGFGAGAGINYKLTLPKEHLAHWLTGNLITSKDLFPLNFIDNTLVLVRSKTSWGSGVVLNAGSGIIITCSHVVKDDNKVTVFQRGNEYLCDVIFKTQDDIAYDLAILKAENGSVFKSEVKFSKTPANIGEAVVTAGFPFFSERDDEHIRPSIATGCISWINPYMIQSTCCIQSGFSGGGLFRDGELLGVIISNVRNSSAGALFPHINFIVPCSTFKDIVLKYVETNDERGLKDLECPDFKVQALWRLQISKL